MQIEIVEVNIIDIKKCKTSIKQMKILCRKSTFEQLILIDTDIVILAKYNKKIIGFCCIAKTSPQLHFEKQAEENNKEIPYIYNYMVDISQKNKKIGFNIMLYLKTRFTNINLNILEHNLRAVAFFTRSNFKEVGIYEIDNKSFRMFSYSYN